MGKNQHVTPRPGGGWQVKGAGNQQPTRITRTKQQAVKIARKISINQGSELFIHGRNGRIQSRDSHGNDSFPPKG
ncbi:DUF2188 domain-containing protein [Bacillus thermotolerans]|uniref:DUF2188 domain-containing protein n=1 Tax=Bacillus thermotolerans TaxID=1221996 RepID=UPI000588EC22|nr:DUF2188 domain-containing protein [Bacillus thermotolerans]